MKVFVIGNIGSGKSTAAKMLAQKLNAKLVDLDKLGHDALNENKSLIEAEFGKFNSRKELAKIADLKKLDELLYPYIYQKMLDSFNEANAVSEKNGVNEANVVSENNIVVEETVYDENFIKHADVVVFVKTSKEIRKQRKANPNFEKLNNNQRHDLEKHADHVITNDGTLDDLEKCCEEFINELF